MMPISCLLPLGHVIITRTFHSFRTVSLILVTGWLSNSGLCFNPSKSDAAISGTHQRTPKFYLSLLFIRITSQALQLSNPVTPFCVTLDSQLSFHDHINNICKSCYFHIKTLRYIQSSPADDICASLAAVVIQSGLDNANSIPYKAPHAYLNRPKRVQNCLAKTLFYATP